MNKVVTINSKVTLSINNIKKTFTVVRSEELGSADSKISNLSPLGKALLQSKVNDVVKVKTPGGETEFKVVGIEKT